MIVLALTSHAVDNAIFRVAEALEVPVLVLALVALGAVIFELGMFAVELRARLSRRVDLETATISARKALLAGDEQEARRTIATVARSAPSTEPSAARSRQASSGRSSAWAGAEDTTGRRGPRETGCRATGFSS